MSHPSLIAHSFRVAAAVLLLAPWTRAEEPWGVSLLMPDSLAGWEHSAEPAEGWAIQDGTLRGSQKSTPLLSGWTLGNFELRFTWTVSDDGQLRLGFPKVPSGPGLELLLARGSIECRFEQAGQSSSGRASIATDGKSHEGVLRRVGRELIVSVDGRRAIQQSLPADARFGLSLAVAKGSAEISNLRLQELAADGTATGMSLFNGRDLTGWWTPGNKDAWGVKDGNLALVARGGNYIRTEKEYGNFTLSLEYKIRRRGNSGIGIRTARSGWPSSDGMELQIEDSRKLDASATMAIYRNVEPLTLAEKTEDWNHVVIKADGRMITAWLNGVLVQQVNTYFLPELRHRPLEGWIGFQDHGAPIEFRNLHIIEAPAGLGLEAWYTPRREPASRLVLDRLMNPERLTLRDGSAAKAASTTVQSPGEHVLADLTGPGAVVRVTRTANTGTLEFYFDGEEEPRIQCPAGQLHQHVPPICGDSNPVLTFLGYEKSLKIVLRADRVRAGDPLKYRIDFVSLPPEMPVETFQHRTQSIARGMLPAIDYRHFQISHGTYRDNDPLPRAASGNKTLPPGERVQLISLNGAGMVKWLRLQATPAIFANDDLWLEVTVDGEAQPALAAPARFLFPGLDAGKGFHNFLVLSKGGYQNVLPMPYGSGLKIAAINRGAKELKNVGLTVSYDPSVGSEPKRLRLRGVFVQGDAASAGELVSLSGSGRWIGLVCQPPAQPAASLSVQTDDRPLSDWQEMPWSLLTGITASEPQTRCLSGQTQNLAWCFHLLSPIDFQRSFRLQSNTANSFGSRLALFYSE